VPRRRRAQPAPAGAAPRPAAGRVLWPQCSAGRPPRRAGPASGGEPAAGARTCSARLRRRLAATPPAAQRLRARAPPRWAAGSSSGRPAGICP